MRPLALVIVASLAPAGCQLEASDFVTSTSQMSSLAASVQAAHVRMHARFTAAARMQEAIVRSDLDRTHAEAHALAQLDEPDALPAWRPYLDGIRDAAHQIESAGDVMAAASLAGTLGRRCARCHVAIAAHVAFPREPRPSANPRIAPQMTGHQWAAAQMWEGLIGPSDDHWIAGAQALTTVPLNIVAQSVTRTSDLDIDDVARVRLYATRALAAKPQDARAEVFGKLLAACTHCHAVLRDR